MHRTITTLLLFCAISSSALPASAVPIPTVPVGNAGNAGELSGEGAGGYGPDAIVGGVAYDYRIGRTEVTNTQYIDFLNAVAATDTYALYHTSMGSNTRGGITRSGSSGSYVYAVKADAGSYTYANKPVVYVSWFDAVRFANWLNNGQGSGDTETGAYTLLGGTPTPSNGQSITRNSDAKWALPSEDEWYKAAYYDGDSSTYYDYPTGTDTTPDHNLPSSDSGNSANFIDFDDGGYTTGDEDHPMIDAGAYTLSASPYGTFDQGGNVWEWNETLIFVRFISTYFGGLRGGSWDYESLNLLSSSRDHNNQSSQNNGFGFRVANVPEPSTALLAAMGIVILAIAAWRRKR